MLTDIQVIGLRARAWRPDRRGRVRLLVPAWRPDRDWATHAQVDAAVAAAAGRFSIALLGVVVVLIIGAGLPGRDPVFTTRVHAEWPALAALLLLLRARLLRASRDRPAALRRRRAIGAAVLWFVAFYPNIASLPVPTPLSQIHLGLLPTWNWGFQFGVNLDPAGGVPLQSGGVILLTVAVVRSVRCRGLRGAQLELAARVSPRRTSANVPEGG